jgi:hypothetical protein
LPPDDELDEDEDDEWPIACAACFLAFLIFFMNEVVAASKVLQGEAGQASPILRWKPGKSVFLLSREFSLGNLQENCRNA